MRLYDIDERLDFLSEVLERAGKPAAEFCESLWITEEAPRTICIKDAEGNESVFSVLDFADADGNVDGALTASVMDLLFCERDNKICSIARFVKVLDGEAALIKDEITRLQARKKATERKAERLRTMLANTLNNTAYKSENSPVVIRFRRSETTEVTDIDALPAEFKVEHIEYTGDKKAIKAAIKAGQNVPGAEIVEHFNMSIL